ncbi:MAG: LUD domain-containing protein [Actinobacteria bacterium]|nr:LUD domain-containing protein [Actinomycetota bacterium]
MSTGREAVLERVRAALGEAPRPTGGPEPAGRSASRSPAPGSPPLLARFVARVTEHGATVRTCTPDAVAAELAALCAELGARRLACPAELPEGRRPPGVELLSDEPPLSPAQLDAVDGALTGAAWAAAETGTVALDHGPGQGRRALSLIPDLHLCLLEAEAVVADIPELIAALGPAAAQGRPLTLISGPSATSDIELERVEGVHGPRRLVIVLLRSSNQPLPTAST